MGKGGRGREVSGEEKKGREGVREGRGEKGDQGEAYSSLGSL